MNFSENKSFCPLAWINVSSDTDGSVRLCCVSDEYIKKPDGNRFNLGYDKVEDIINSDNLKSIRQDMLEGKPITGCYKCYDAEKNNGISYRKQYINIWKDDSAFLKKYQQSLESPEIDNTVEYYDLRFGNLCNLACRSCYAGASSQFNKDIHALQHTAISKFHGVNDNDLTSWYETEIFDHNIKTQLPNLKEYYVTGGEPTINDKNYQVLTELIESGHSKHCTLKFNTNLTNTKKDFYSLLPHFKSNIIMGSVDGYKEMQEYLRYPSNWNQISNNIDRLVKMNLTNLRFILTPVIQKTNLGRITELFEYVEEYNRSYDKTVIYMSPIVLMDPPYLDFNYLPLDYKIKCWEKIEKWINERCKYQDKIFHWRMNQIKTKCHQDIDYSNNLRDYFEFTEIFDTHRSESLQDLNPELYQLKA